MACPSDSVSECTWGMTLWGGVRGSLNALFVPSKVTLTSRGIYYPRMVPPRGTSVSEEGSIVLPRLVLPLPEGANSLY